MIDPYYEQKPALGNTITQRSLFIVATMEWENEVAYAMTSLKILTVPIGGWPLQEYNKFALTRHILSTCGLVCFSILRLQQEHHTRVSPLFSIYVKIN